MILTNINNNHFRLGYYNISSGEVDLKYNLNSIDKNNIKSNNKNDLKKENYPNKDKESEEETEHKNNIKGLNVINLLEKIKNESLDNIITFYNDNKKYDINIEKKLVKYLITYDPKTNKDEMKEYIIIPDK